MALRSSLHRRFIVATAALFSLGTASEAVHATGMQGHMYMAQCAAEQTTEPRLRAIFDAHALHLENGAIFPDSGYTAKDHDQGEIAHWEQYIQGYVETLRERYGAPLDDPEGAAQAAFMMGAAAHGITDSTFDSLFMDRAALIEPGDFGVFDLSMDVFLVHDMPRYYIPELTFDAALLSDIYTKKIPHDVAPQAISDAMSTARTGVAAVTKLLQVGADDYGKKFPWARAHLLDRRTPGGYAHGAKVVVGYYRELLRRLDGDTTADEVVIGTYPDDEFSLATLDNTRPDGRVIFFTGEGIDRASLDDGSVVVRDDAGNVVPTKVGVFRGDKWANAITVTSSMPWKASTKYSVVFAKTVKTLSGASPSKDLNLSFTTCTPTSPGSAGGDCPEPTGPLPASRCPKVDAKYVTPLDQVPVEPDPVEPDPVVPPVEDPEPTPPTTKPPTTQESSGCAVTGARGEEGLGVTLALAAAALAFMRRRSD